ncbi:efflux RND transporter permease subunit [Pseudomonas aeruginosa]
MSPAPGVFACLNASSTRHRATLAGPAGGAGDGRVGIGSYQKLSIDAVPDITNVQVQINTAAPGYSPLEVEQRDHPPGGDRHGRLCRFAGTRRCRGRGFPR